MWQKYDLSLKAKSLARGGKTCLPVVGKDFQELKTVECGSGNLRYELSPARFLLLLAAAELMQ